MNRLLNKKFWLVLIMLLVSVTFSSCQKEDTIMRDYPSITDENHVFEETTINDIIEKLTNKESFYLIMGFPECPWCQSLMPVLNEVAKNYEQKIYYLNIKDMRDNEENKEHEMYLQLQENYFREAVDVEKNRLNAPTFVKVISGKMKRYHLNTVSTHRLNENNVLPQLTTEEKDELETILKNFFE